MMENDWMCGNCKMTKNESSKPENCIYLWTRWHDFTCKSILQGF